MSTRSRSSNAASSPWNGRTTVLGAGGRRSGWSSSVGASSNASSAHSVSPRGDPTGSDNVWLWRSGGAGAGGDGDADARTALTHGDLGHAEAEATGPTRQLGAGVAVARLRGECLPHATSHERECAIHVDVAAPALEAANDPVRAPRPITGGDLSTSIDCVQEMVELADVELTVSGGDKDQLIARLGTIAAAADWQAWHTGAQLAQAAGRLADDDDLEPLWRQSVQDGGQVEDGSIDVLVGDDEGGDPGRLLALHSARSIRSAC